MGLVKSIVYTLGYAIMMPKPVTDQTPGIVIRDALSALACINRLGKTFLPAATSDAAVNDRFIVA